MKIELKELVDKKAAQIDKMPDKDGMQPRQPVIVSLGFVKDLRDKDPLKSGKWKKMKGGSHELLGPSNSTSYTLAMEPDIFTSYSRSGVKSNEGYRIELIPAIFVFHREDGIVVAANISPTSAQDINAVCIQHLSGSFSKGKTGIDKLKVLGQIGLIGIVDTYVCDVGQYTIIGITAQRKYTVIQSENEVGKSDGKIATDLVASVITTVKAK